MRSVPLLNVGCCPIWAMILLLAAAPHPASAGVAATPSAQSGSAGQGTSQTLTNEDIIKMVRAHLGADIIVEQIRSNPCYFSLSTGGLIKLKQAGVPDRVISEMQKKARPTAPAQTVPPAKSDPSESRDAASTGPTEGQWQISYKEDQIDGEEMKSRFGMMVRTVEDNGRKGEAQITATCDERGDRDSYLELRVAYFPKFGEDVGFRQSPWSEVFDPANPLKALEFEGPVRMRRDQSLYVRYSIRIDDNVEQHVYILDHPNELAHRFRFTEGQAFSIYEAHKILIELPLANGDDPTVEIDPQDPSFRKFAGGCYGSGSSSDPEYTIEQFEGKLPEILKKAATDQGLDAGYYDPELNYIKRFLDTCAISQGDLWQKNFCDRHYMMRSGFEDLSEFVRVKVSDNDLFLRTGLPPDQWKPGVHYQLSLRIFKEAICVEPCNKDYTDIFTNVRIKNREVASPSPSVASGQADGAVVAPPANPMLRDDLPKPELSPEPPVLQTVAEPTWVDQHTGLMWPKRDSGKNMTSTDAGAYCSSLRIGNFTDWRLPTARELKTVYDDSVVAKTPRGQEYYANGNVGLTSVIVWSNSKKKDDPVMMYFGTGDGTGRLVPKETQVLDRYATALCVRKK